MSLSRLKVKTIIWMALACAISLAVGYFLGKELCWAMFDLDYSISLVDIVTLFVTVVAAGYITHVIQNANEQESVEKQIIFAKLERIEAMVRDAASNAITGSFDTGVADGLYKKIGSSIERVERNLKLMGMDFSIEVNQILQIFQEAKILATYDPPITGTPIQNPPLSIMNGSYMYNNLRIGEIDSKLEELSDSISALQVKVNRH